MPRPGAPVSSNGADLDTTIQQLNTMLQGEGLSVKDRLSITDRLLKAYAMKLKFAADRKGGKFNQLPDPPVSTT